MTAFMYIVSLILFLFAAIGTIVAPTAIHSIYGAVLGTASAVFWIGGAIVDAIDKHAAAMKRLQEAAAYKPPPPGAATKTCTYCDAKISATAAACPKCGKVL